ncbi:MAG TPA: hypothetical protein VLA53_06420 [Nitrosopumilaceae archaeon]|nr:hypothetical protein [Nitrosopumilaceae archaeon]
MNKISSFVLILSLLFVSGFSSAFAHKTITVENLEIEVGWQDEPPLVGFMNAITFEINENTSDGQSGVKNAFKSLVATIKSGGLEKTLDIDSDPQAGHYHSKIIPTRTGSLVVELKGDIDGIPIDSEIFVEDVEDKSLLAFPDTAGSSDQDITALKNAMSGLQTEISSLKSKIGGKDITSSNFSVETAYNFGIFGLSLGAAGVILAIVAMIKRK